MSDLLNTLTFLSSNQSSSMNNPFEDNEDTELEKDNSEIVDDEFSNISIDNYFKSKNKSKKPKKKNNKTLELFDELDNLDKYLSKKESFGSELINTFNEINKLDLIDASEDFDEYIDNFFEDDENVELRNSLISLGRKYARDTATTAEENEIKQAYAPNEKKLKDLYNEINIDKDAIQKDIDNLRIARSRNFKTLSELTETKRGYIDTQLSIIKEVNKMKKDQFDLKYKDAKLHPETSEDEDISTNTIRTLFGMGKADMINAIGGYSEISGGNASDEDDLDDEAFHSKYVESLSDSENTDSNFDNRFVDYEGTPINYILWIDTNENVKDITVEDNEGNEIQNYPKPSNIQSLDFNIDTKTMSATDNYYRDYIVKFV